MSKSNIDNQKLVKKLQAEIMVLNKYHEVLKKQVQTEINIIINDLTNKYDIERPNTKEILDDYIKMQNEVPRRGRGKEYILHNLIYNSLNNAISESKYCSMFDLHLSVFNKYSKEVNNYNTKSKTSTETNDTNPTNTDIIHIEI